MQGMTERARSLQNSPYCHAPRQCKGACHVHHPVGTQDILRFNGTQRIADGGLGVVFAKVIGGPGQLHPQRTGAGALGLGAVGAGVVPAVPPPDLPRPFCVIVRKGRGSHPQQGGKAAGKVICREAREITISLDSKGWRSTSKTFLSNSGSSSKNKTPKCAKVISPGLGYEPPPTNATAEAVWCGARKGRCPKVCGLFATE